MYEIEIWKIDRRINIERWRHRWWAVSVENSEEE